MSQPSRPDAQRLGSAYVLDARIGAGAQGEVWRAHSVVAPDEPLAVKLLSADVTGDDHLLERFLKERSTLMRVSSPYVVGVRDMVVEGTTFAIVMSYVGGGDLRGLMTTTGPFTPADTARVGALIARGLAAVHAAGIVHRDVKPANVLIDWGATAPGADDAGATQVVGVDTRFTPRLADFGVARLTETVSSSRTTAAVGTPLYMAPEVLDPRPPTSAADVYSLGVVLYEMSCGVTPFLGSAGQVLAQHARRDPGRPDGVPDALWALLVAMLAKNPVERPTALAVAESLEAMTTALAGLPAPAALSAPPASVPTARPYEWDASAAPQAGQDTLAVAGATGATAQAGTALTVDEQVAPTLYGRVVPATAASGPVGPALSPTTPAQAPVGVPQATAALSPSHPAPRAGSPQPAPNPHGTPTPPVPTAPRRRRRALVVSAVAAVLVIALVAAGTWWWTHRQPADTGLTALPAPGSPTQVQTVADVDALLIAPGGGALATAHESTTWRLHDLASSNEAPVWESTCSSAAFWNATHLLCDRSADDGGDVLVAVDGTQSPVPGPEKRQLLGASQETAVVVDGSYTGSLIGLDSTGAEAWRAYGAYGKGRVRHGFVVAWESDKKELVVLAADTGTVLLTHPLDTEPDWDEPLPGGVGIDVGPEAFYVHDAEAGTWSVYGADGTLAGEASTAVERTGWAVSGDVSAEELLALISGASTEPGAVTVRGSERTVTAMVDLSACSVSVDGVSLELPALEEDATCALWAVGLVGGDGALLVQTGVGDNRISETARLLALNLDDGTTSWSLDGAYMSVLPPSARAGGSLADLPVLVTMRPDGFRTDVVLSVVAKD